MTTGDLFERKMAQRSILSTGTLQSIWHSSRGHKFRFLRKETRFWTEQYLHSQAVFFFFSFFFFEGVCVWKEKKNWQQSGKCNPAKNNTTSAVHLTLRRENKLSVIFFFEFWAEGGSKTWIGEALARSFNHSAKYTTSWCARLCGLPHVFPSHCALFEELYFHFVWDHNSSVDNLSVLTSCCGIFMFLRFKVWSYVALKSTMFWVVQRLLRICNSLLGLQS